MQDVLKSRQWKSREHWDKTPIFCNIVPCIPLKVHQRFGNAACFMLVSWTLRVGRTYSSETSIHFRRSTPMWEAQVLPLIKFRLTIDVRVTIGLELRWELRHEDVWGMAVAAASDKLSTGWRCNKSLLRPGHFTLGTYWIRVCIAMG
jgi:hypothetical protein